MGHSLPVDPRERVAALVAAGHSRRAAARHFAVGDSSAIRLMQRVAASGSCEPDRRRWPPGIGKLFKRSYDPAFAEKVEDIVGLTMDPPARAVVLSVDEKSQFQALERTRAD